MEALKTILNRFEHGVKPMGDFVEKTSLSQNDGYIQKTLFDSVDLDESPAENCLASWHRTITDFSIFLPDRSLPEAEKVVENWKDRKIEKTD